MKMRNSFDAIQIGILGGALLFVLVAFVAICIIGWQARKG